MKQPWHVYIVRCRGGSLYTGITTDVARRFGEHQRQGARCAKYLRGKAPLELVFQAQVGSRSDALKVERQLKGAAKIRKEALISGELALTEVIGSSSGSADG